MLVHVFKSDSAVQCARSMQRSCRMVIGILGGGRHVSTVHISLRRMCCRGKISDVVNADAAARAEADHAHPQAQNSMRHGADAERMLPC